jgi:hypothetical protein
MTQKYTPGHTPGPWQTYVAGSGTWRHEIRAPAGTAYRTVALLRSLGHERHDAKLIAAGPELLAALQVMVLTPGILRHLEATDPMALKQARAAIAKAKGSS